MTLPYTEIQLDALREVANIGSGTAATSLSMMLGRPVDLSVPTSHVLTLADAVDAVGSAQDVVVGVVIPVFGDLDGVVLLVFGPDEAAALCTLLGVDPEAEIGRSALGEVGNILGCAYAGALGLLAGIHLEPRPTECVEDMLGAIVSSILVESVEAPGLVLLVESELSLEDVECSFAFVFVPDAPSVRQLLTRLGIEE